MNTLVQSGMSMATVPAHGLKRGDVVGLSGSWRTVWRNDDSTEGETSTRSIVLVDADGHASTWEVIAKENVAVLRDSCRIGTVRDLAALLPEELRERIEPELLAESPSGAALLVLSSVKDPRWTGFVRGARIDWTGMLAWARSGRPSSCVAVRVELAASLAGAVDARPELARAAAALDGSNFRVFLDALRVAQEGLER